MSAKPKSEGVIARRVVLDLVCSKREFPTRAFPDLADKRGLESRDRALARAMLAGVIRRRRTLDALIRPCASRKQIDPAVRWTLRLALYQRFFMEGVPPYAAFNATLDAAKPIIRRGLGFTNAVLRAVDRMAREEKPPKHELDPQRLDLETRSWWFDRPVFPDPEKDLTGYLADAHSFPPALVSRWLKEVGEEKTLNRLKRFNETPPLTLRVNRLRASRETVADALRTGGIEAEVTELENALVVHQPTGEVSRLPGFIEGFWSVQDLSSQASVLLGRTRPGSQVLDLCAAPGGKSFATYELCGGDVRILACDVNKVRLRRLNEDMLRLGHEIETRHLEPGVAPRPESGEWDVILLDVPCTNSGVLGRRPGARWKFDAEELKRCLSTQEAILKSLSACLGPRTRIVWSTCSLEPEENLQMAQKAAELFGMRVSEHETFEPTHERSGGFAALLTPGA